MDRPVQVRTAAYVTITGILFWVATVVFLSMLNADTYNSVKQPGSELALGRFGTLMDIAFFALGIGIAALAFGLYRAVPHTFVIPLLLGAAGALIFFSGIFHTEIGSGTKPSIHNTLGLLAFVLSIVVMFTASRRFRRDGRWRPFARPTLFWAIAALGTLFLVPLLGDERLGIAQRIFVTVLLSWFFATALQLQRVLSKP